MSKNNFCKLSTLKYFDGIAYGQNLYSLIKYVLYLKVHYNLYIVVLSHYLKDVYVKILSVLFDILLRLPDLFGYNKNDICH